ncbi:uncharacterized protein AKAW2_40681A [Aspergillus luchuensis]|uniref:Uncharacterized protein n=1 Tax=Aspergillus kawachii TaxID=1069201 RepID=A0A7R7WYM3_ASPKA|nr:uncharacterized protein AKAW2_40681A [Aspergillus luchuensis]BCR98998.1 hypothetical protein AKAW2_40681A [Aspergillus luchuensis]BCS11310.1 hypothetical protein ALUC_40650A [Aspergillus luchuensis]
MSTSEHTSPPRVLRVPRSDEPDSYVLLHVARTNTAALDLNLTATEGEFPYNGVVRQARAKTHRSKGYQGTDEDWVLILLRALGQLEINTDNSDLLSGIELSASIKGQGRQGNQLVLTIRRRVQTITQRLGSIALKQDDEQAIQLFDWSAIAVARADMLEQQLLKLQRHYHEADSTIEQLNKQIEDFISAKRRHEEQLMTNFTQVLNQKKLKIRNQQRLLASAKIDVDDAGKHQAASSKVGARVGSKKHAKRPIVETSDDDAESDNGSESLDQTKPQTSPGRISDTDDEPNSTPQPLEDVDDTTDEDSPTASGIDQGVSEQNKTEEAYHPSRMQKQSPPPRRELPFTRGSGSRKDTIQDLQHQQDNAEETAGETDDDEL